MKEKKPDTIAKLQDKIRVLEAENERLSERAEDIVLLSMISEHLLEYTDRKKMMDYVLEEISILKRIPYAAVASFSKSNEIDFLAQYTTFSTTDDILFQPVFDETIKKKLFETGSIVKMPLDRKTAHQLFPDFEQENFYPVYALFFGVKLFSPLDFFLFVDDKSDAAERMENFIASFIQITNLMTTRFENLRLNEQLQHQNNWLVQEVNQKTAKLREKIDYQSQIIDHSLDGIILHKNYIIEYANPSALKILEVDDLPAIIGRSIFDFVEPDPEEKKIIKSRVSQVVEKNKGIPFRETKIVTANGNPKTLEIGGIPFNDGNDVMVHLTLHDVTEKKAMERELDEERTLFMGGPTVIFKWNDQENFPLRYVSPNVFDQFGYKPEDFLHNKINYNALIHPGDRKRILMEIDQHKKDKIYQYEQQYRLLHADGSYRHVIDFTIYHPISKGTSYFHGYVIDISKQVKAEKALHTSETRFRAMVEYSFEGIGLIDEHYTFTYANQNLAKILGYPHKEVEGADFRKFLSPESKKLVVDRYRRRQAGEDVPAQYEFTIQQKNGNSRMVLLSSSVIKDENDKKLSVIQLIDVTEKRMSEIALKEAHRQLQENFNSLQTIQRITDAVRLPVDTATLARKAIDALSQYTATPSVAFYMLNKADQLLEMVDAKGFPKTIMPHIAKVPLTKSFSGRAIQKRRVIFSSYENKDPDSFFATNLIVNKGFKTTLSIPLIYQEEAIGVVNLLFKKVYQPSEVEQKTLLAMGRTIGIALANTHQLEALEKEINQRKRTEDELRASEEKFRVAFDNSLDAITISTMREGRFVEVNRGFETITGYKRSEAIGKTAKELNIWPDPNDRKNALQQIKKNGYLLNATLRFKVKQGNIITTSSNLQKVTIDNKIYLLHVARDMTQLLEAQKALKESEEKFRVAFDNSLDPMTLTTMDGYYMDVNQGFINATGYQRQEVIGKSTRDIQIWENEAQREHMLKKLTNKKMLTNYSARFRVKDGRLVDSLLSVQKVKIKGKFYLLTISRDITELLHLQEAMKENAQRFSLIFNHASDAMFLLEPQGLKPPLIHDLNETACRLHQYTKAELTGASMQILMANKENPKVAAMLQQIMEGKSVLFESKHQKKDGTVFTIEISAQKVTIGGRDFILSIDRDITERKAIEKELEKHRKKLEELVKERTSELEKVNQNLKRKNLELTRYNDVFINREFRIKELREEVRKLKKQLGEETW